MVSTTTLQSAETADEEQLSLHLVDLPKPAKEIEQIWVFLHRFDHHSLKRFKISTFFDHADSCFTVSRHDKNLKSKIFLICGKSSMFYKQEKTTTFESL